LALVGLGILIGGIVLLSKPEREPEYGGKKLSEWVERLPPYHWEEIPAEAAVAIRHTGTNALPYLLGWIAWDPSRWKTGYHEMKGTLLNEWSPTWMSDDRRYLRSMKTARAFQVLGRTANGAVPELTRLLNDSNAPALRWDRAAQALGYIGKDALPVLLAASTNTTFYNNRSFALTGIGFMGTDARPAIPTLIQLLSHADGGVAEASVRVLGELKLEPGLVLPALVQSLQDPRSHIRYAAASSLGLFEADAEAALPALVKALEDHDATLRFFATNSVRQIKKALERATAP